MMLLRACCVIELKDNNIIYFSEKQQYFLLILSYWRHVTVFRISSDHRYKTFKYPLHVVLIKFNVIWNPIKHTPVLKFCLNSVIIGCIYTCDILRVA
jgi:hypothetical protein